MDIAIYGCPPLRISDRIVTNLGKIKDWYIEEHFSYIRVFGCSVPPHAYEIDRCAERWHIKLC
jgi:hypothetical protein